VVEVAASTCLQSSGAACGAPPPAIDREGLICLSPFGSMIPTGFGEGLTLNVPQAMRPRVPAIGHVCWP